MDIHYAVLTATGINDRPRALAGAQEALTVRDTFADAKAEVIARADAVLEYLVSTDRSYAMHVESRDQHFEVRFEYGPASAEPTLPFRMVLQVSRCTLRHGLMEPVASDDVGALPHQRPHDRSDPGGRRPDCASEKDVRPLVPLTAERRHDRSRRGLRPFPA